MIYYSSMDTPIQRLLLVSDGENLTGLHMQTRKHGAIVGPDWIRSDSPFAEVKRQLASYFRGTLKEFDIPILLNGTPFQRRVWEALQQIPYGSTTSYGEIAVVLGIPGAARAVGFANSRNPVGIVVPCHRVLGKNGLLTGYDGGLSAKQALLDLERVSVAADAVRETDAGIRE
ncbi:MAG TPA: methylated-DNA--[protein]-cysteine S-methyltransferase [Armatimonadota bacterium]|nr:methylated-DNA--[protein]-cysteine S-methyltransferase [Armatimonadota bacterium]